MNSFKFAQHPHVRNTVGKGQEWVCMRRNWSQLGSRMGLHEGQVVAIIGAQRVI